MIDGDALLRKICGDSCGCEPDECGYIDEYRHERCKAGQYVANAPTVNEWISVKERLPEKQVPVLVCVPPYSDGEEAYFRHVGMAYYTYSGRGGFWAGTDGNVYGAIGIIHEPTHWMPLPEPPKEDDDEK